MSLPEPQFEARIHFPGSTNYINDQTRELPIPGVRTPDSINGHALYTQNHRAAPLNFPANDLFSLRKTTTTRLPAILEEDEPVYVRTRTTRTTRLPPIRHEEPTYLRSRTTHPTGLPSIPEEEEPSYLRPKSTRPPQLPTIQEEPENRRNLVATKSRLTEEDLLLQQEQAENAHYTFGTSIDDSINDHAIHRQETRSGLALKGMYSYSDGYFKRTVHYEADENGYRVVK